MTVYVDDMRAAYRTMFMFHMIADTDDELHVMAATIGVQRRWCQAPPRHTSHYDISLGKRELAVKAGAIEITMRQAAMMIRRRKNTGELGSPDDIERWYNEYIKSKNDIQSLVDHRE